MAYFLSLSCFYRCYVLSKANSITLLSPFDIHLFPNFPMHTSWTWAATLADRHFSPVFNPYSRVCSDVAHGVRYSGYSCRLTYSFGVSNANCPETCIYAIPGRKSMIGLKKQWCFPTWFVTEYWLCLLYVCCKRMAARCNPHGKYALHRQIILTTMDDRLISLTMAIIPIPSTVNNGENTYTLALQIRGRSNWKVCKGIKGFWTSTHCGEPPRSNSLDYCLFYLL